MNRDHSRVTDAGKAIGEQVARVTDKAIARLVSQGLEDQRCNSCAFRLGTVPNGCPQTQLDALKAVAEGVDFMCHQSPGNSEHCFGWVAARAALEEAGAPDVKVPWDFSPAE